MAGTAINRIIGSTDLYDPVHRGESASVNFLTCHDGFTLYDLYSYNTKHNEKNGWNNTDGDNNGNSWNCGVEGETDDPQIEGLRRRMVKKMRLRRCSAAADRRCSTAATSSATRSSATTMPTVRTISYPGWTGRDWKNTGDS